MSRGRKPDALAVRRGASTSDAAAPAPSGGVEKPPAVLAHAPMSALWDQLVGTGRAFQPQDAPYIEQLVFSLETARQCRANLMDENGNVQVLVGKGEPDEDGRYRDYVENPWLSALERVGQLERLGRCALGLTPLARARLGLTQATAIATVSIADQIYAAMRGGGK